MRISSHSLIGKTAVLYLADAGSIPAESYSELPGLAGPTARECSPEPWKIGKQLIG